MGLRAGRLLGVHGGKYVCSAFFKFHYLFFFACIWDGDRRLHHDFGGVSIDERWVFAGYFPDLLKYSIFAEELVI